jgi:hypothetical protein
VAGIEPPASVTVTNLRPDPDPVTDFNPLISVVKNGDSREFVAENLCPKSLAAHESCTIKVELVAGRLYYQQSATLSVTDSSPGSPLEVSLTALTKELWAQLSATSLSFGTLGRVIRTPLGASRVGMQPHCRALIRSAISAFKIA